MRLICAAILLLLSIRAFPQKRWTAPDVVKLEDADVHLEIGDYNSALKVYNVLYQRYGGSEDLEFKIAYSHYSLGHWDEADSFFQKAHKAGNVNAAYYLGLHAHRNASLEEAIKWFQVFKNTEGKKSFTLDDADRMIETCDRAKRMMADPVKAVVYNLGETVNTEFDDYGPLITEDEGLLVFTSRRPGTTGDKKDPYGEYLEDIYMVSNRDDKWQEVRNAGLPLNSKTHDAAVGLSADGKILVIYRTNKELTSGDLYLSHFADGSWSEPAILNPAINSEYQEASASLTVDERVIYFSSNRPGGFGGKDLYRVVRISPEIWSLPLNLGPTINTSFDEDAPYIHPDEKTLYFSSKGNKSMGGYDIFRTSLLEDYWSTAENLGSPAHTVRDYIFFVLAADGRRGYYSTDLGDGFGGHDIYAVSFEDSYEKLRILKGRITGEAGHPVAAEINLQNSKGESYGTYRSNARTGNYVIILPPDEHFVLLVNSQGMMEKKEEFYYRGGTGVKEKIMNFTLQSPSEN